MTVTDEILFMSVREIARRLRRGSFTATALTEACLDRITRHAPALNTFVTVTSALALEQAHQADAEMRSGKHRGPLHGIPYAVKDLFSTRRYPTTWGARPFAGRIIDEDAAVITRLGEAGAVLLGKTAMSELAGGPPMASATGPCRAPWNPDCWAGGSSGGSAAAVASGFCAFALGTETWGSIMTPSSFCGVAGLRPTFGTISRYGAMPLAWSMDKVGILSRSARDCAVVVEALSGHDPRDPGTAGPPLTVPFGKLADRIRNLRVGFVREDYHRWGDPDVGAAFDQARATLRNAGIATAEITLPPFPYEDIATTIIAAEQASSFESLVTSGDIREIIDAERRGELLGGQLIPAVEYLRAQRLRSVIQNAFVPILSHHDIILGSSTLACAPSIAATMDEIFPGGNTIEAAENLLGLPGISVPCGFNARELPIGLKIIGKPWGDATVLQFAEFYQSLTSWHTRHPAL